MVQISESARVLAKQIIKEAGEPSQAIQAIGQADVAAPQQDAQATEKLDNEIDANMKLALDGILKNLPSIAQTFAQTKGNKDGKLEIGVNQQAVNEVFATMAGVSLAGPAIVKMMGKATNWLGKKLDNTTIAQASEKITKFAEKWHHTYEDSLFKFLRKMVPPAYNDDEVKKASKVLFLAIIASMGVVSGAGAAHLASAGQAGAAGVETALASIKANEVIGPVKAALGKILSVYFA